MRIKRSAQKARQKRDRQRRQAMRGLAGRKVLRCETLESRVLLDAGGLLGADGLLPPDVPPPFDPGAVSGRVWADADGNRQYDGAELGMGGVTVYSDFNFNGQLDPDEPSTVTEFDIPETDFDEGGLYTLGDLQPGWHNIRQVTPSGFEQTYPSLPEGFLPPPWGDASVHVSFVEPGQTVDGLDFGNQELVPGVVSGTKWEDINGNGVRDNNEPGLAGVTIFSDRNFNGLPDADEPQTVTSEDDPMTDFDEAGLYVLDGLEPGWHWIKEVVPDGYRQTFPSFDFFSPPGFEDGTGDQLFLPPFAGSAHDVLIESGTTVDGLDFGNQEILPGSISGVKWEDVNGDGIRGASEPGLAGVTIYADLNYNYQRDADEPFAVTSADDPTTDFDEAGRYSFAVEPGYYYVREVVPEGYRQTFPYADQWLADPVPFIGILPPQDGAHFVWVESGQSIEGIDFGNQRVELGSINGVKWEDTNGNGVRDNNEAGLAGVTIYADTNFNGVLDANEPLAVTTADIPETDFDEGGRYSLAVEAGLYAVREIVPDGYMQTFPNFDHPTPYPSPLLRPSLPGEELAHFVFVDPGQSVEDVDFGNRRIEPGSISGMKWEDANGNAEFDPWESGLAGVTIYADLNNNQQLDAGEPSAVTTADIPETDFDEAGRYTLAGLAAGDYVIREVVPDGFRQTFPLNGLSQTFDSSTDILVDEFSSVNPERLDIELAPGEIFQTEVSITLFPNFFAPVEIDVMAEPAEGLFINLSGIQTNGGGGDVSTFEIMLLGFGDEYQGELQFVDLAGGNVIDSIPLTINSSNSGAGAHRVTLGPGESIEGIDFGNQAIETGTASVSGRKWEDLNGDGVQDADEQGLGGVTIYADANLNGVFDAGEVSTVTMEDIPETDFDEAGLYQMELDSGEYLISEVVPDGYEQTFPNNAVIAIFPPPPGGRSHFVTLAPGDSVEGLDFGNRLIETGLVSGTVWTDLNGNGVRDLDEPGMSGVTVYADYNFNSQLDAGEPSTETIEHPPFVDSPEDLTGTYILQVRPGFTAIREIVPDGHFQTFPTSDAATLFEQGAHFVTVESGEQISDLDFGNQPLDNFPAGVSGTKWEDLNANGQREADEPGLDGVTIYSDLNGNGQLDADEPSVVTMEDIPETDFDEAGLYSLGDLAAGFHAIREVVPAGFVVTYPISAAASPLEQAVHFVNLGIGEHLDGLDFGNYRLDVPPPGDFNADGTVNGEDLDVWQESYGSGSNPVATNAATVGEPMSGSDFLLWQRHYGQTTTQPPETNFAASVERAPAAAEPMQTAPAFEPTVASFAGLTLESSHAMSGGSRRVQDAAVEEAFAEPVWLAPQLSSAYEPAQQAASVTSDDNADVESADDDTSALDAAFASAFVL